MSRLGFALRVVGAGVAVVWMAASSLAQERLSFRIDDEISHFDFSTDGKIAYSVRHVFSEKKIRLQRDDLWVMDRDGKRKKILQGEKFVRGTGPFSYLVRGLRWSPTGTKLAVEIATSEMINEKGDTREDVSTLLLDENGSEIQIAGGDSVMRNAANAVWLANGATVVYLTEQPQAAPASAAAAKPAAIDSPAAPAIKLFTLHRMSTLETGATAVLPGHVFSAVAWKRNADGGVAIEREAGANGSARLVELNLKQETLRVLATIQDYTGGVSVSPSGKKVAYWVSNEQLEVRDVSSPNRVARVRVVLGTLAWAGDEMRLLVKQGPVGKSGSLVWVSLPPLSQVAAGATPATVDVALPSILHDLEFRQFDISPDGNSLAVIEPGKRNLLVYAVM